MNNLNGLAIIILPAGTTIDQLKAIFTDAVNHIAMDNQEDLSKGKILFVPDSELLAPDSPIRTNNMILADNLITTCGNPQNKLSFLSKFLRGYYGPENVITHDVVSSIASIPVGSRDFNYYIRNGLEFLVVKCKSMV